MRSIAKFLGVSPTTDSDFIKLDRNKVAGSCEWLLDKPSFKKWKDRDGRESPNAVGGHIYWLSGDPGCGKSYLAAHVVKHLQSLDRDTSYYFLRHSDTSKRTMGILLKTIAFQMAGSSASLRRSLLSIQKEDILSGESNDIGAIWKQLFVQRVFRFGPEHRQYWIIDALDEGTGADDLLTQLHSLPKNYNVFITSRRDHELEKSLRHIQSTVTMESVNKEDTSRDIRSYLELYKDELPADNEIELQSLIQKLLRKSSGSFLWTSLIVQALGNYWTDLDVESVVNNVPDGMHPLYRRILEQISRSPNQMLAHIILRWVICAARPLTTDELRIALREETSRNLVRAVKAIESICGPLVHVQSGRVELAHDTVRDYLFNKEGRSRDNIVEGFVFDKAASHEHLAAKCVTFIINYFSAKKGDYFSSSGLDTSEHAFLDYAAKNFSSHLAKCRAADQTGETSRLIKSLMEFFEGPVLFWIEYIAKEASDQSLSSLTWAGKNLKAFVEQHANGQAELSPPFGDLREWADDLIHIVTVFGKELSKRPDAIHNIIPPLCPPNSKIHRAFGDLGAGIQVLGGPRGSWPDRISCVSFGKDFATALASCEQRYAVSLRSKQILIYHGTTCQETCRMQSVEPVRRLEFAHMNSWLVAAGRTTISLYNYVTGDVIWTVNSTDEIMALAITANDLEIITVNREKNVESLELRSGMRLNSRHLEHSKTPGRPPQFVHVSEDLGLLVLITRNEEPELYDLRGLRQPKGRINQATSVVSVAFNPLKKMIAMSSFNGETFTVNVHSLKKIRSTKANASHMAVSTDGQTLILGDNQGSIQILKFDTLDLIQKIPYEEEEVMGLCFTRSSLRFLDIRRQEFNVWEPAALIRRKDDDESGSSAPSSTFTSAPSQRLETTARADKSAINAIAEHHSGEYVFCAKESGSVSLYDTMRGKPKRTLFEFGKTAVLNLIWNKAQSLLASADNSSTVKIHRVRLMTERIAGGTRDTWLCEKIFQSTCEQPIRQLLFSLDGRLLLVSTTKKDLIFNVKDGLKLLMHDCDNPSAVQQSQKWATSPWKERQFIEIQNGPSHTFSWNKENPPAITLDDRKPTSYSSTTTYGKAHIEDLGDSFFGAYDNDPHSAPIIWRQHIARLQEADSQEAPEAALVARFTEIAPQIARFLGIYKNKLVFLDIESWVCSVRVDESRLSEPITYHFPMPHYWLSANRPLLAFTTAKGDIVIPVEGELAIVKHAL